LALYKFLTGTLFLIGMMGTACHSAPPNFKGERAFSFLKAQCDFGPRVPGSMAHQKCQEYLIKTLKANTPNVTTQAFSYTLGPLKQKQTGYNIIARFQPLKTPRLLLCAHWDSRPWADEDPVLANRQKPVPGANDGASGVAVLLHLAELIAAQPTSVGIDIVLFDAEDSGDHQHDRSWALGSAAFAREYARQFSPRFGILLDMIGDADLTLFKEANSAQHARAVVDRIWSRAADLGIGEFIAQVGYAVFDDHIPLLEAGIPCVDLIDFDYPYWHTVNDTPDKCSAASLEKIGRVLTAIIYEEK
jgi:glutaminyl-peptide cyclotransferase